DLVVANFSSSTISVLLGNGDGTFQTAKDYSTGSGPLSLAVGDLDGQPGDDIVTANLGDVSVLLNNGDGTFKSPQSVSIGDTSPLSVAVGDFDGNGNMDLGVTSNVYNVVRYIGPYGYYYYYGYYTGQANVLLGNGGGDFSLQSTTALNSGFP